MQCHTIFFSNRTCSNKTTSYLQEPASRVEIRSGKEAMRSESIHSFTSKPKLLCSIARRSAWSYITSTTLQTSYTTSQLTPSTRLQLSTPHHLITSLKSRLFDHHEMSMQPTPFLFVVGELLNWHVPNKPVTQQHSSDASS